MYNAFLTRGFFFKRIQIAKCNRQSQIKRCSIWVKAITSLDSHPRVGLINSDPSLYCTFPDQLIFTKLSHLPVSLSPSISLTRNNTLTHTMPNLVCQQQNQSISMMGLFCFIICMIWIMEMDGF